MIKSQRMVALRAFLTENRKGKGTSQEWSQFNNTKMDFRCWREKCDLRLINRVSEVNDI